MPAAGRQPRRHITIHEVAGQRPALPASAMETSVSPAPHAAPLECLHDRIHPARHPLPRPALALPVQARRRPARRARGL
ncbi:hypothetical protein D7Y39_07445 [Stenotrophomonas maltophilia]|nr:hypothetical protein [Stenotrophomonas maltophilia]